MGNVICVEGIVDLARNEVYELSYRYVDCVAIVCDRLIVRVLRLLLVRCCDVAMIGS